jgi:hypothetical protein
MITTAYNIVGTERFDQTGATTMQEVHIYHIGFRENPLIPSTFSGISD